MMPGDSESLLNLLNQHLIWYPLMELQDIYKLLYQGVLGSEHLVTSPQEFASQLNVEFDLHKPDQFQNLLEPVRADETLFRLNLRAYKYRWKTTDQLLSSLLGTSRSINGSQTILQDVWVAFSELCEGGHYGQFKSSTILGFSHWLSEMGFPAVHHSEIYRHEYQPAYRLIAAQYIPELGLSNAG